MNIDIETVKHIEKALNVKLYEYQIEYLLGENSMISNRRIGKTFIYCVKLALTDGRPIDIKSSQHIIGYKDDDIIYEANRHFIQTFMNVRNKLKKYGFKVRKIKE